MSKIYIFTKDYVLALLILILWSLSVILIPNIQHTVSVATLKNFALLYTFLHIVTFLFVIYLAISLVISIIRKKTPPSLNALFHIFLYVYALVSLSISAVLIGNLFYSLFF